MARRGTHFGTKSPLRIDTTYGFYIGSGTSWTQITTAAAALNNIASLGVSLANLTATAGELNALDGITSSVSELNILDGVTATKGEINMIDGLTVNLANLTATAGELNALDGITSSVSELNILDGVTATKGEINMIDGLTISLANLTATAGELNALDGITSNVTELNLVDNLTALINAETAGWNINKGRVSNFAATKFDIAHGMSSTTGLYIFFQPWYGATADTYQGGHAHIFQWEVNGAASFDLYGWTLSGVAATRELPGVDFLAVGAR